MIVMFTMAILSCAQAMWAIVAATKSNGSIRPTMQMNTWLRGGKFQCVTDVSAKYSGILSESGPKGLSCPIGSWPETGLWLGGDSSTLRDYSGVIHALDCAAT